MNVFEGWKITSPYGYRSDPFTGSRVFHTGIDLVKYHKYPIPAFVGGVVLFAGEGVSGTGFGGYGNVVALRDEKGYVHCYCHLDSVVVRKGQTLSKGDIVGNQGTTGRSTGSHLHYEVRSKDSPFYGYGSHVDPTEYLKNCLEGEEDMVLREELNILKSQYNTVLSTLDKHIEKITALEQRSSYDNPPNWAVEAVNRAIESKLIDTPNGGSYDFYRIITVLHRKGII